MTTARQMEQALIAQGIDPTQPGVTQVMHQVFELEHQGMEPGAYSVSMPQYIEVAFDLCLGIAAQSR